jgi:dTDP-3,4-didehydro-2,6-dideoxy-alpha-D-glucose 3-reductase
MTKQVKNNIIVWGLGNHACKKILPAVFSSKTFTLAGVCSRSEKIVKFYAKEFSCDGWTDPINMLNTQKIHSVFISTPIAVHFEMAVMSLKANKNVMCEKPLTCNFDHTKSLINLAKKNKKMLVEAFMFLYHPQFIRLQNIVNNNELGEIHSVICRFGIPTLDEPGFRNDAELCGGALWDVGSYTIAAVLGLFNDQNVEVLFSEIKKHENSEVDSEGRAILLFAKGTIAYLEWGTGVSYKNEIDLWADNGSLYTEKIFSKPKNYLPIYRMRNQFGKESFVDGECADQFIEMFKSFSDVSKSSTKIEVEYERIFRRAKVMDQILNFSKYSNN